MLSLADTARPARATPRKRYARIPEVLPIPNLIQLQLDSFRWFIDHGLRAVDKVAVLSFPHHESPRFLNVVTIFEPYSGFFG